MNWPQRPKCKHTVDIPLGGAVTVTPDPAAVARAIMTCGSCEIERLEARVAELETALRSCLATCPCGTFATWTAYDVGGGGGVRPRFCDVCKVEKERDVYGSGRLRGRPIYEDWQRLTRNIELTRTYAASAAPPLGSEVPKP